MALALVAAAAGWSGCADTHRTEVESVRGTADALLASCAADRPQDAVELLDAPARQAFIRAGGSQAGCLDLLGLRFPGATPVEVAAALERTRVTSVRAGDLSGSAELHAPDGTRSRIEVEDSRGIWYVAHPAVSGR